MKWLMVNDGDFIGRMGSDFGRKIGLYGQAMRRWGYWR